MTERDFELPDAETLAYQMSEAVADQEGDAAQEYLVRFMDELFQLEPGLRQHFTGALLEELCEGEQSTEQVTELTHEQKAEILAKHGIRLRNAPPSPLVGKGR